MASWNKPRQQDDQENCPICLAHVCRKRISKHIHECKEAKAELLDRADLIVCPLYPNHVMPKRYFNHHLDGNCDAANNALRKYFNSGKYNLEDAVVPVNFRPDLPKEYLNNHNRKLLYLLLRENNDLDSQMQKMDEDESQNRSNLDVD